MQVCSNFSVPTFTSFIFQKPNDLPVTEIPYMSTEGITEFAFKSKNLDIAELQTITAFSADPAFNYMIRLTGISSGSPAAEYEDTSICFDLVRSLVHKSGVPLIKTNASSWKDVTSQAPFCEVKLLDNTFSIYAYGSLTGGTVLARATIFVTSSS